MNIEDAVKVLNEFKHLNYSWRIYRGGETVAEAIVPDSEDWGDLPSLTPFEAIAVAEKLVRDAGKPAAEPMTAADWFGCLVEAGETGDANAASVAAAELRALGWEVKATDGTWGDRRSMPATRKLLDLIGDAAIASKSPYHYGPRRVGHSTIELVDADINAALAEWPGKSAIVAEWSNQLDQTKKTEA